MNKTIIFISGWQVPKFIAKSQLVWNESFWPDYNKIWVSSKTPISNKMVERELDRLEYLINLFPGATLAGHSLGGWWASNLALRPNLIIKKLVLWTPLGDTEPFPIFKAGDHFHPAYLQSHSSNYGPAKVLVFHAKKDRIVPPRSHALNLAKHFNAQTYQLNGGHFYQNNHQAGLQYMKDWIEI